MSPCPGRGRSGAPGQLPQPADMRHARPPSLMLSSANAGGCQSPGPPERSSAGPSPCRDLLRLWDDLRIRLQSLFKNPNNYRMEIGNCQRIRVVTRSQAAEPQAGTDRITGMRIPSRLDVRFRADFVRFAPSNRHSGQGWECLKLTRSRHLIAICGRWSMPLMPVTLHRPQDAFESMVGPSH